MHIKAWERTCVATRSARGVSDVHPEYGVSAAARFMVTTIRVTPEQWEWLRDRAHERAKQRHGGRADASEIVRELLEEAMRVES